MCDRISPLVFVFVTAAAGMVPCASASPQDSAVASVWGEVHGALTDPLGAPLAGVPLQLALPWIRVASTTTDAAGRFHIAQVPPGDYWLELLTTDLVFTRAVEVAVTSATAVHLEPVTALKAASLGGRVVLELGGGPVADTLVRGVVTDASTGQPIPGVRVSVAGPMVPGSPGFREPMIEGHYWQRVYTDERGEYVLQLAAGEWKVEATRDGYVPTDRRQERPFTAVPPGPVERSFSLQPSHTFSGLVRDASTGEPLPYVGVFLWGARQRDGRVNEILFGRFTETDAQGRFTNAALGAWQGEGDVAYQFVIVSPSHCLALTPFVTPDDPPIEMALTPGVPNARAQLGTFGPVVEVGGRRIPLTPPPPAHPAGATPPAAGPETSTPGFKVSCAVVMPNRTAVQGLMVELLKEGEIQPQDLFEKPRTMPTDPRGVAVFHGIPPGAYTAIVRPEGQVKGDWERLGLPAGVAQAQVHVRDRDVLGILLRFESSTEAGAGVIAGVVQDAQGKPWGDNVRVRLFRNEGRGGQPAAPDVRTDLGGRFRFVNISPGSYEIMTMTTGTYGDDDPGLSCMTPRFMLAAGESREDIVMVMDIGATIRGCATDRQGKPLGRIVDIIAMQRTDKGLRFVARSRHMASDGSYVFTQLPAGELLLFDWSGAYLTTVTAERGKTIENLNFAYDAVPEHKVYMGMEQQMLKAP